MENENINLDQTTDNTPNPTEVPEKSNVEIFEELLLSTEYQGIQDFLNKFIKKSDFYTAPASQMKHNAKEGGLLEHSLNVYNILCRKFEEESSWHKMLEDGRVTKNELIIVGLLHDLYKVNRFVPETRNVKVYDTDVVETYPLSDRKYDQIANKYYVWMATQSYSVKDSFPCGTTEKSIVFLTKSLPSIKWSEIAAIRWIGGPRDTPGMFAEAVRKYPLVLAAYEADMEAMYLIEN